MGPQYMMVELGEAGRHPPPPPPRRRARRSHCGCGFFCGCLCWYFCCYFLLVLLIIAAVAASVIYLNPKPPSYSITNFAITDFNFSSDFDIRTKITITVKAENPNDKIGISYGDDSKVRLAYRDIDLCSGALPSFYQDYHNVTVVTVEMNGKSELKAEAGEALRADKKKGEVPVEVYVKVPVKLRIVGVDTKYITIDVKCELVLDNIEPNKKIGIKSAKYSVEW